MDFGKIKNRKMLFNPLLSTNAGKNNTVSTFANHIPQKLPVKQRKTRVMWDSNLYDPLKNAALLTVSIVCPKKILKRAGNNDPWRAKYVTQR